MRFCFALVLVATLAGCSGSNVPINGQVMYTDGGCRLGCDKCPVNTFCLSYPYQSVCLQHCTKTSDCATGEQCALINLPNSSYGCVTSDRPVWCTKQACNIQAKCRDANTLLQPLDYSDLVCAWAVVPCPNGCDATAAQCK